MSIWLEKCPVPISESPQIASARLLLSETSLLPGQTGSPRVVATAWRLTSTVTRSRAAGRRPSIGVTVPASAA